MFLLNFLETRAFQVNNIKTFKYSDSTHKYKPTTKKDLVNDYNKHIKSLKEFGEEGIIKLLEGSRDPIQRARVIEFDAKKANIDRFQNSPCWGKLYYTPMENYDVQDARFKACEEAFYKERIKKGLLYFLIITMIILLSLLFIKERKFLQKTE